MANTVEFKQQPGKISIGQLYASGKRVYIIAAAPEGACQLTNLATGLRYSDPVRAENKDNITLDEFRKLCDGDNFTRITVPITITPGA